jgi:hypothetical protein
MASMRTNRSCTLQGIGRDRGNLNLLACVLALGFNKFRVQVRPAQ